jgi:Mg/Co/Ni transporter MgtE
MPMTAEHTKLFNDLASALAADILASCSPDEIEQLIEEMEARRREPK